MVRISRIAAIWVGIATLAGLNACNQPWAESRSTTAPAAHHAVRSEQLRKIMSQINKDRSVYWPQELNASRARPPQARDFRKAKKLARLLGDASRQIPDAVTDVPMSETERMDFQAIVDQLAEGADQLSAAAAARDRKHMRTAMSRIQTTCHGCHARFSRFAGELPEDWPGS